MGYGFLTPSIPLAPHIIYFYYLSIIAVKRLLKNLFNI